VEIEEEETEIPGERTDSSRSHDVAAGKLDHSIILNKNKEIAMN
jgi:hypothetical protein